MEAGEGFMDERCLSVGISLAVVTMLLGKPSLELLVACGDGCVGSQQVTELHPLNPPLAAEDDKVEMMSPLAEGVPHQPAAVG